MEPIGFIWLIALAASTGFMLPRGNAAECHRDGTLRGHRAAMQRGGALLDFLCIAVVVAFGLMLAPLAS